MSDLSISKEIPIKYRKYYSNLQLSHIIYVSTNYTVATQWQCTGQAHNALNNQHYHTIYKVSEWNDRPIRFRYHYCQALQGIMGRAIVCIRDALVSNERHEPPAALLRCERQKKILIIPIRGPKVHSSAVRYRSQMIDHSLESQKSAEDVHQVHLNF